MLVPSPGADAPSAPAYDPLPQRTRSTHVQYATVLTLAAGFFGVLAAGFFMGFANTWPIVVFVLAGAALLNRG
jgi:uncharacterized membrane protein